VTATPARGRPAIHVHEPHPMSAAQRLYLWITGIFVTCLLVADLIGSKLFTVRVLGYEVSHSVGMLAFPVTFVLTDLLNEYYGKHATRRVVFIGFACAALTFLFLQLGQMIPVASFSPVSQPEFDSVFGNARRMYIASLAAYLVGSLLDIFVFGVLKRVTRGKLLWLRATGSTVVSQLIDSFVVTTIYFASLGTLGDGTPVTAKFIAARAVTGYVLKFVIAIGLTPAIYAGHGAMHRWFGLVPVPPDDPAVVQP
jgi:uncharacterized integral membrane protein (TIGR00697 family)